MKWVLQYTRQGEVSAAMGCLHAGDNSMQLCQGEMCVTEGTVHNRQSIEQGITESSNVCIIFPVSDMDEMN